ncbi:hypothetical protein LAUMK191_02429 [Mycobacterium attenuatum]|uniref:Uncharacterized protein n=1 Tax=Mycobacterium attenuatum TaxID=2341086 RepID=A0A498Q3F4_9MYCO|nr:hypothetical protein LAUMK136_02426 [Mycobacterium attenuatum]VBA52286.1 hypothetical protein LAUMK191_02429 [Mycobacterium attenuatum]VBA57544.1 hypothetical protein LAUMK41_02517 [Mycobacterium attenuatum]
MCPSHAGSGSVHRFGDDIPAKICRQVSERCTHPAQLLRKARFAPPVEQLAIGGTR